MIVVVVPKLFSDMPPLWNTLSVYAASLDYGFASHRCLFNEKCFHAFGHKPAHVVFSVS